MKKIITLSLSLLIIAGLHAADSETSDDTKIIHVLEFAMWDVIRLVNSKDITSFEKFNKAFNSAS